MPDQNASPFTEMYNRLRSDPFKRVEEEYKIDPNKKIEVVADGQRIILPKDMSDEEAIYHITKHRDEQEQLVSIVHTIDASPLDGAVALSRVLTTRFGHTTLGTGEGGGLFGTFPIPPKLISVEVGPGQYIQVPWGKYAIPGVKGTVASGFSRKDERFVFTIHGEIKRQSEAILNQIADLVRQEVKDNSIYKGRAIRVKFRDKDGDLISGFDPSFAPAYLDTAPTKPEEAVYNPDTEELIRLSLHLPIIHTEEFLKRGIPLKRGVLLEGHYGTGKSLCANILAKICERYRWTFIELKEVEDLRYAFDFARQYAPAVVLAEDVDEVTSGERDSDMNRLMEMMDGVSAKNSNIIFVFTTNHAEKIHRAFLRAGRIDTVIPFQSPTLETAIKILRVYSQDQIDATDGELMEAIRPIEGRNAATIRDAMTRSLQLAVSNSQDRVTARMINLACLSMQRQLELTDEPSQKEDTLEKAIQTIGECMNSVI